MGPDDRTGLRFLKPLGQQILEHVAANDSELVERVRPRLLSSTSARTFRRHWIDIEFAYEWLQKGISYVHEPRLDEAKRMEWHTGADEEKRADFGIKPDGRSLCLEIKTLEPVDHRPGAAQGPFVEEFHRRAEATLEEYPHVPGVRLRMTTAISTLGGDLSSAVKAADRALDRAARASKSVEDLPIMHKGDCIGYLTIDGRRGIGTIQHGHGSSKTDVINLLKKAQTARNCPSVVVLNTIGEVTPTPFELADKLSGILRSSGAFDSAHARHTSAVLLYPANDQRELIVNPNAERPLTTTEQRILEIPYEWPAPAS